MLLKRRRRSRRAVIVFLALMVAGCAPRAADVVPVPQGIVRVQGVLLPAGLSTVRRGSFFLSQGGRMVYYAESPTIPLHRFVGCDCSFRGVVEPNSDPAALPVLVVQEVEGGEVLSPSSSSSSSASSLSFSSPLSPGGSGVPCGGERGVLCPAGEYCVVESFESTSGHCRSIHNRF